MTRHGDQAATARTDSEAAPPDAPARLDPNAVLTTLFRADGAVLLQNAAARAAFAMAAGDDGLSPFLRHFLDPRDGTRLLRHAAAGETVRAELPVHTTAGVRRFLVEASPAAAAEGADTLVMLTERAAVPAAAHDGEQRLRDYAEAAADWFWEMDAALRFSYMSGSTHLPGDSFSAKFIGRHVSEVPGTGMEAEDWRPLIDMLEVHLPFRDFRLRRRTARGELRHLSVSGVPVFDAQGTFRGYRGVGRDLTLLVRAEEHAAIAQSRLVDAIESIPACFMLLDADDRLVLCNSRYREVHAMVAPLLVPGTRFEDICRTAARRGLVQPADGDTEGWARARLARHANPKPEIEERQVGERWFQVSERRTSDGGMVVVQTEITALKRREQELAEKTALLRATLDNMEQGLLVLDAALRVKLWNGRLLKLFDAGPEAIWVGRPMAEIIRSLAIRGDYGAGDIDRIVEARLETLRRGEPAVSERRLPNGRVVERRLAAMPEGGWLATYLDVTERQRVEADLRRAKEEAELASRTKTEFLANMSHELRTPLNAIIGFSDILTGQIFGPLGDKRYVGYAGDIHDSGLHLLNLINDVLDVSKVEFGKVELIEETLDITSILESCVRLMRERADAAGVRLAQALADGLPFVQADGRRLKQILLNLMSNAVKFTPPGGTVTVAVAAGEDGFRVSVADTGIGMAPVDLEKALKPFGQIDSRLARKYQGTGLGLPLTKSMAELHGGRLEIESIPGEGTTATVWLPPARLIWPLMAAAPAPGL